MSAAAVSPWQEVGEHCYRRRYDSYDLNIGVVRGSDALLLIDTRCHDREAAELLDELKVFGAAPIRWIVNTHWHFDHTFGNAAVARAAAPTVEIWGHRVMRDELLRWSDDARARHTVNRPEWTADFEAVEIVAPDRVFDDVAVVDLGDRSVRLQYFGPAHTGGDLVAFVDDARVVFAGDLVEESAPPSFGPDCHVLDWPVCNAAMLGHISDAATLVPGHGDVVDRAFVARQLADLVTVADLIRELHDDGVGVNEIIAAGRGRWPFPEECFVEAVGPGYAARTRETRA
jgi:glyoxylase-like metal-dependent hydrolase (beta-lactamase superfamily II)